LVNLMACASSQTLRIWQIMVVCRARALGIGLLSGGYGTEERERSGAYRVYEDPADLLVHIDEVGGRR
jgi:hypothetical protein